MKPPASLEELTRVDRGYPLGCVSEAGCETALVLFGAGFYGRTDGVWLAQAGLRADVVDHDREHLKVMRRIYPESWVFECRDVREYVDEAIAAGRRWDVLSVDPPIRLCEPAATMLPTLAKLASRLIVVTRLAGVDDPVPPPGWYQSGRYRRSCGADWVVLARVTTTTG